MANANSNAKHTLSDAACWHDGHIVEFLDDGEFDAWGIRYPEGDLLPLSLPLHPGADWYAVGYGQLVACVDDGSQWGRGVARLDAATLTWTPA